MNATNIELQLRLMIAGVKRPHNWQQPLSEAQVYRAGEKEGIAVSKHNAFRIKR